MTIKERYDIVAAYSTINSAINELKYYQRAKWLSDTGALESAESAKEFLRKVLFKNKKK